jgi:hypothetical protein
MGSTKLLEPGQFDIQKIILITSEGKEIDLLELKAVSEIQLYESIGASAITGYIAIFDTVGLSNIGPIMGQEYLKLVISTPSLTGDNTLINFDEDVLHVTKVVARDNIRDASTNLLEFVSSEVIHSKRTRVNRTLKGTYSELAKTLLQNDLQCKKDLYIETSVGQKQIITPNSAPFSLISRWAQQAVSKEHGSPTFHFYENTKGYHFRSIESMYAEGSKFTYVESVPSAKTGKEPGISSGPDVDAKLTRDLAAIQNYTTSQGKDFFKTAPLGGFSSTMIQHDIFYKKYDTSGYNYFDNRENEKHINSFAGEGDNPIYNDAVVDKQGRRMSDFTYATFYTPTTKVKDKNGVYKNSQYEVYSNDERRYNFEPRKSESWLQRRRSNLVNLETAGTLTVSVHGNTSIGCGDVVTVNLPEAGQNKSTKDGKDRFYKGQFLIKALRHTFNNPTQKHSIILNLNKDSVLDKFKKEDGFVEPKPKKSGEIFDDDYFYVNNE